MSTHPAPWPLQDGWSWAPLGDTCTIERHKADAVTDETVYVGLEHIESKTGRITPATVGDTGVSGDGFAFDNESILYGKLRPYLNKVALPIDQGICSTDILPLRPGKDVDRHFLAFVLRSRYFCAETARLTNGQLPRISPTALGKIVIPVPPPAEQAELGRTLQRYATLAENCEDAAEAVSGLPAAYLQRQMEAAATKGTSWSWTTLGQVTTDIQYGINASASDGFAEPLAGSHRFVRITDINASGDLKRGGAVYFVALTHDVVAKYRLTEGDLLFARTGFSIGNTYMYRKADGPAVFASYIIRARIDPKKLNPTFVATFMQARSSRESIWHAARGKGKPNLSIPRISAFEVPQPPNDVQLEVVEQDRVARMVAKQLRELRDEMLDLVLALADRAMHACPAAAA